METLILPTEYTVDDGTEIISIPDSSDLDSDKQELVRTAEDLLSPHPRITFSNEEIGQAISRVVYAARLGGSDQDQGKLDKAIRPLVAMIKANQL